MDSTSSTILDQVNYSTNAMLMLNASCQGIVEIYIEPTSDSWYIVLENELVIAQRLVREWRTNGSLYFNEYVLSATISCGQSFGNAETQIIGYFDQLINADNNTIKTALVNALNLIKKQVDQINGSISNYETQLKTWGDKMQNAHTSMNITITTIQNQEVALQTQINAINATIANLQTQIQTDRDAIAKAKSDEKTGTLETIFGILLSPVTGGASLILAGIGVASICEAQTLIDGLQASIQNYQTQILGDQQNITDDQKEVATLQGLTLSTGICLTDMDMIADSLDKLRVMWQSYSDNLGDIVMKINASEDTREYIVGKAWFTAACLEWVNVISNAQSYITNPITTTHIQI